MMKSKTETQISQLHERLMKKFMNQIDESVRGIQVIAENNADDPRTEAAVTQIHEQEVDGPDKINVIRHNVAADEDLVILDPDKQKELLEILKQAYEQFKHELRGMVSEEHSLAELTTQKFKDELLAYAKKKLADKKYAFSG